MALRSGQPPGRDWEDSFHTLDARMRELQKRFNAKEEELKLLKVSARKRGLGAEGTAPAAGHRAKKQSKRPMKQGKGGLAASRAFEGHMIESVSAGSSLSRGGRTSSGGRVVAVPSAAASPPLMAADVDEGAFPDPAMIWVGGEQREVSHALFHANETLRRELREASAKVQGLEAELGAARSALLQKESTVSGLREEVFRLVEERDSAVSGKDRAKLELSDLHGAVTNRSTELTTLRSRLVAAVDQNERLQRELRQAVGKADVAAAEVATLRSELACAQSSLAAQRHTNEELLREMKSAHEQLRDERKRVLELAQEIQRYALQEQRSDALREQLAAQQKNSVEAEAEHVALLRQFMSVSENAMEQAREAVKEEVSEWKRAATHWEDAAKRLYKDITQRNALHQKCRQDCEAAKEAHDAMADRLRETERTLEVCLSKLNVAWPGHERVTTVLPPEEVKRLMDATVALQGLQREAAAETKDQDRRQQAAPPVASPAPSPASLLHAHTSPAAALKKEEAEALGLTNLPHDPTTAAEKLWELSEAHAGVCAELEQLHQTNAILQERIDRMAELHRQKDEAVGKAEAREAVGHARLAAELDRVHFLEKQVNSLRGHAVPPSVPLALTQGFSTSEESDDLWANENVLELFLGQIISSSPAGGTATANSFNTSTFFCSADFLLHETVLTPSMVGLNGFLDTTIAYCISMDTLLLYYLVTRDLVVQLHRVRDESEWAEQRSGCDGVSGHPSTATTCTVEELERMYETVAEGRCRLLDFVLDEKQLNAERPVLRGHVHFYSVHGQTSGPIASAEFTLSARLPFSKAFKKIVSEAAEELQRGWTEEEVQRWQPGSGAPLHTTVVSPSPLLPSPSEGEWVEGVPKTLGGWLRRVGSEKVMGQSQLPVAMHQSRLAGRSSLAPSSSSRSSVAMRRSPPALPPQHTAEESTSTPTVAEAAARKALPPPPDAVLLNLSIEIEHVQLPTSLSPPLPRLRCFYALRSLNREVTLPASLISRSGNQDQYIQRFSQPLGGNSFAIRDEAERAAARHEPLTLFFVDENEFPSTPVGSGEGRETRGNVWAFAVCGLEAVVDEPGLRHVRELPLLGREGAVVRLYLHSSNPAPRASSGKGVGGGVVAGGPAGSSSIQTTQSFTPPVYSAFSPYVRPPESSQTTSEEGPRELGAAAEENRLQLGWPRALTPPAPPPLMEETTSIIEEALVEQELQHALRR